MARGVRTGGKTIIIILIALVLAGVGYFIYYKYSNMKMEIQKANQTINNLNETIISIGELSTAYVLRANVSFGKEIKDTDLEPMDMPLSMVANMVTNLNDIRGKFYRINISQGTALTWDMVAEESISSDTRLLDIAATTIPIGLKTNSYVDIRITFPYGEDFIAMPKKKVIQVNNGVIKIAASEYDIHVYNSMLVDAFSYPSTSIYAIEYIESGAQEEAKKYYPVSKTVLSVMELNPGINLTATTKNDITLRRQLLENALANAARDDLDALIKKKDELSKKLMEANSELLRLWEKQADERKKQEEALLRQQLESVGSN